MLRSMCRLSLFSFLDPSVCKVIMLRRVKSAPLVNGPHSALKTGQGGKSKRICGKPLNSGVDT
jgi:hypothetical protein